MRSQEVYASLLESILREIFPGQDEKFYEYGKWGGGAMDSDSYYNLPKETQDSIEEYLKIKGLLE